MTFRIFQRAGARLKIAALHFSKIGDVTFANELANILLDFHRVVA